MAHTLNRAPAWIAVACTVALLEGCTHGMLKSRVAPGTSPAPETPWVAPAPPPGGARPEGAAPQGVPAIPPDLLAAADHFTLADLVDVALRNSPRTRAAWSSARSAAADLGGTYGARYPVIAGQLGAGVIQGSVAGGEFKYYSTSFSPLVVLNWLVLDFGGRRATIDAAREALVAADWLHNAAIQDVVLEVEQAYYLFVNARALGEAEATAVKEAEASLDAAETRRRAGLATIADVLQAKTVLSRARLALETVEGQIETIRGALATAMGLPANTRFDVTLPPLDPPRDQVAIEIERAIRDAQERRPDLAAARADAERAEADLRARSASDRPTLNLIGSGGQAYYWLNGFHQNVYNASLVLTIPIFNGLTYHYNVSKAEADRDVARARLASLEQDATLQVWTSYYRHRTAARKVATSRDLLESATQSFDVVSARYKAGLGSILDLLTAQSALEGARAEQTQARTEWYMTLAQLAHDTGTLSQPGAAASDPAGKEEGTP